MKTITLINQPLKTQYAHEDSGEPVLPPKVLQFPHVHVDYMNQVLQQLEKVEAERDAAREDARVVRFVYYMTLISAAIIICLVAA